MEPMAAALAACLAVSPTTDQVRAGDLAAASPAFAALDPDTVIGWAPAPGVRRIFAAAELRRLATRLGAPEATQTDICVERRLAPLDPGRILAALETQAPEAELTLLDFSRARAPEGELWFPRSGLRRGPGGAYFWNGAVRYGGARRFSIWAKIRARSKAPVVVAAADLKPGQPVESGQVRLETRDEMPVAASVGSLEQAIGKCPRRPIRAGTPLAALWLEPAPEVARGETVKVDVWSGSAHLPMDALAEGAAAFGARVSLRNPATRKRFLARVSGRGRVAVGSAPNPEKPEGNP